MGSDPKILKFEDVTVHNKTKDCWLIISGKVYDVTPFMDDHPGGDEVLLAATGKDATEDFEDTGHSDNAREMMEKYYIGELDSSTLPKKREFVSTEQVQSKPDKPNEFVIKILQVLVPVFVLGIAFGIRQYGQENLSS